MSACNKRPTQISSFSETGALDEYGNIIPDSEFVYTNIVITTNNVYVTNEKYVTNTHTIVITNVKVPPSKASDYYSLYVPYSSASHNGYYSVSYKDTDKLKELWLNQMRGKGYGGKPFNIRNRDNKKSLDTYQEDGDYYYFDGDGDIRYAGADNLGYKYGKIKKLVGAVIVKLRRNGVEMDSYTVGGLYALALNRDGEKGYEELYANATHGRDGVKDFIMARIQKKIMNAGWETKFQERRRYFYKGFLEVLVFNHSYTPSKHEFALDSYYPTFGQFTYPDFVSEYTEVQMPYMTNYNIYLGERPEYTIPFIKATVHFSEWRSYGPIWQYSFLPSY